MIKGAMVNMDLLPGIGLILVSSWLVVFGALFMLVFLLIAALSQRDLPFRRRWAFSMLVGMGPPFILGWMGIGLFYLKIPVWRGFLDNISLGVAILPCLLVFLSGMAWGWWRY